MKEAKDLSTEALHPTQDAKSAQAQEEPQAEHRILLELIEDLDKRREVMQKVEAIEDLLQTSEQFKQEKLQLWTDRLRKHPRTIARWLEKAEKEGLAPECWDTVPQSPGESRLIHHSRQSEYPSTLCSSNL